MSKIKMIIPAFVILFVFGYVSIVFASSGTGAGGTVTLTPPIPDTDPNVLIGRIIKYVLGVVGSLALLMFVYGGLIWMTSMGSSEKVTKGKNILIWSTLGLVVIFVSYAVIFFVLKSVLGVNN